MFRKLFSHCGKITYNFPCIHTVRRRKMFKTLIFQECFIFLKIWQTTFSTTNSGGKIWRKKSVQEHQCKKQSWNRQHKNIQMKLSKFINQEFPQTKPKLKLTLKPTEWFSDSVTILKIIEILKPKHFWQLLFPDIYWNWTSFAILAVSICRHCRQKWFREPSKTT